MKDGTELCADIAAPIVDLCQDSEAATRAEEEEDEEGEETEEKEMMMVVVEDRDKPQGKRSNDSVAAGGQDVDHSVLDRYMISRPPCLGKCPRTLASNVKCVCGIVPARAKSKRKESIWAQVPEHMKHLANPPPPHRFNDLGSQPAGLTNLGATCYINAVLQALFAITQYRNPIVQLEREALMTEHSTSDVLLQLRDLFINMALSAKAYVDTSSLAKTLRIDCGEHQDTLEFWSLFLELVDRSWANLASAVHENKLRRSLTTSQLFRGTSSYSTECTVCRKLSPSSNKIEQFCEIQLDIQSSSALEECIGDYFREEALTGENGYYCSNCSKKCDAIRKAQLHQLPPYLCFQLKRFVFDMKTFQRKKVKNLIKVPLKLDMSVFLNTSATDSTSGSGDRVDNEGQHCYDLFACFLHKGSSTQQGHYVAQVNRAPWSCEPSQSDWWLFDDEYVEKLGDRPVDDGSKDQPSVSGKKEPKTKREHPDAEDAAEYAKGEGDDAENAIASVASDVAKDVNGNEKKSGDDYMSSRNVYVLIYRSAKGLALGPDIDKDGGVADVFSIISSQLSQEEVQKKLDENEEMKQEAAAYKKQKQEMEELVEARRKHVRDTLKRMRVSAPSPNRILAIIISRDVVFVPTPWLEQWAHSMVDPPLTTSGLLCKHGNLELGRLNAVKLVTRSGWESIKDSLSDGPPLDSSKLCRPCVLDEIQSAGDVSALRSMKTVILDKVNRGEVEANIESGYLVDRAWFRRWRLKKSLEIRSHREPVDGILCEHHQLKPDVPFEIVPEELWAVVEQVYSVIEATSGRGTVPLSAIRAIDREKECALCIEALHNQEASLELEKDRKQHLKDTLPQVARDDVLWFSNGDAVSLVPVDWYNTIKRYLKSGVRKTDIRPKHACLQNDICPHGLLNHPVPDLYRDPKTRLYRQSSADDQESGDHFKLVPTGLARGLFECFGVDDKAALDKLSVHVGAAEEKRGGGESEDEPIALKVVGVKECLECKSSREISERLAQCTYDQGELHFHILRGGAVGGGPLDLVASANASTDFTTGVNDTQMATKRRRRMRRKSKDHFSLKVGSDFTLSELKLAITEKTDKHPLDQHLYYNGTLLDDHCQTLQALWIPAGAELDLHLTDALGDLDDCDVWQWASEQANALQSLSSPSLAPISSSSSAADANNDNKTSAGRNKKREGFHGSIMTGGP